MCMGLDATVYCNCYETGRLRTPPPPSASVYVYEDGSLACGNVEAEKEFDEWLENGACEHKGGVAIGHYLGNLTRVGLVREGLREYADTFPMMLGKVVYNGVHCGDYIGLDEIERLREEVLRLESIHSAEPRHERALRYFEEQMHELIACALQMKKPIAF
jgi:hypothetical protein